MPAVFSPTRINKIKIQKAQGYNSQDVLIGNIMHQALCFFNSFCF